MYVELSAQQIKCWGRNPNLHIGANNCTLLTTYMFVKTKWLKLLPHHIISYHIADYKRVLAILNLNLQFLIFVQFYMFYHSELSSKYNTGHLLNKF